MENNSCKTTLDPTANRESSSLTPSNVVHHPAAVAWRKVDATGGIQSVQIKATNVRRIAGHAEAMQGDYNLQGVNATPTAHGWWRTEAQIKSLPPLRPNSK